MSRMNWGLLRLDRRGRSPRINHPPRRSRTGSGAAARSSATGAWSGLVAASVLVFAPGASADCAPADPNNPAAPVTVTADSLPRVQIDGVVWQQTVIGDTVYAVGRFNTARPAGAADDPAQNILAFSLSTGRLITTFTASLNAQALAVAASPDGRRLYVGGDFTQMNGGAASRVVALNPTTGATIPGWAPAMSSSVRAIVATPETVYLGGSFNSVGSTSRSRLAAARASDGSLRPWRPSAGDGRVNALVMAPDRSKLVAGGTFTTLNGTSQPGFGLGAVDAVNRGNLPTPVNAVVRNAGSYAGTRPFRVTGRAGTRRASCTVPKTGTGTSRVRSPPIGPIWTLNGSRTAWGTRSACSPPTPPCTRRGTPRLQPD
jgi:hypothetical protein